LGSRNTSFFHAQTVIRRKRNKIHGITLPFGIWCTDNEVLKIEALRYFKDLFCTRDQLISTTPSYSGSRLQESQVQKLMTEVTKLEVHQALMSMKSYKSPGPDGFQPIFFKMFWDDIGDDIWKFVKNAFERGIMDPQSVESLMILIPKVDNPRTFKEFRPISLCNVTCKLVSKVLVNRLRPMLTDIVSPLQSSFIPGRGTIDNAIILQEFIYHMQKSKKKLGDVIYKLDLEKAYDRVDWGFLQDTLNYFGFSPSIISLIMSSISATSVSILWNGSRTEKFNPLRGLRQGDPLSPYLFVLCMERLGDMIEKSVQDGNWQPLQLSPGGPKISHLFFADDVLLFAKAKYNQAQYITNLLNNFCSISGMKVSLEKSRIYASKGVGRSTKESLEQLTQIKFTDRLDKYLGFKMKYERTTKEDFLDIYDRVASKLSSWKGRLLNKPGRVTLAKAVLTSLSTYCMQIQWFPQYACDTLDKGVRNFIWHGMNDHAMHMVRWNKIIQPRNKGGLGIRTARLQNTALLGKLVWSLLQSEDKLWVSLLEDKYLKEGKLFLDKKVKAITKTLSILEDGFQFKIGDGETNIWFQPWILKQPLCDLIQDISPTDICLKIKDLWNHERCIIESLHTTFPSTITQAIQNLNLCIIPSIEDTWIWNGNLNGEYSTRCGYHWLLSRHEVEIFKDTWSWIWKLPSQLVFNSLFGKLVIVQYLPKQF